jgi:hypothetical protein
VGSLNYNYSSINLAYMPCHAMYRYEGVEVQLLLTMALGVTPLPHYPQGKSSQYPLTRRLGDTRANVKKRTNYYPCHEPNPGCAAHSQSLYQLSYSGSPVRF